MRSAEGAAILAEVARATALREGPEGVLALLRAVVRGRAGRLQDAARAARLPLPVATAVRRELEKAGILERRHGLALTARGRELVERGLGLAPAASLVCGRCAGAGVVLPSAAPVERLTALLATAPPLDVTLDQAPCTPETALRRAALMHEAGAVEGRRIVLLGDDDSVALALGLLVRALTGGPPAVPVTVLELDPNRVAFLRAAAAAEGLPVEVVPHDLREPLPAGLRGRFDVFETDPPYTPAGARLFLERAREALDPAQTGYGYLSYAQRPPAEQRALLALLTGLGFAATAIRPGFNRYLGASILGGTGQLLELVTADAPPPPPATAWRGPLYSHELDPRPRRYRCAGCGAVTALGEAGAPATIEALKAAGCPACGGTTFRRLPGRGEPGPPGPPGHGPGRPRG